MHYIDEYYEPLSPKLLETLCDIANGLGTKGIAAKHVLPLNSAQQRLNRIYKNLNIYSDVEGHPNPVAIKKRITAVLKASRIGLIMFDYDTCQYVPNPDFKQPDKISLPKTTRKEDWDKKILTDEQISRAKELLISGEMCRSRIVFEVLKANKGTNYPAGKKKLMEIEAELEAQGYKCPKRPQALEAHLKKTHSNMPNANHPWRKAARAGYLASLEKQESQS